MVDLPLRRLAAQPEPLARLLRWRQITKVGPTKQSDAKAQRAAEAVSRAQVEPCLMNHGGARTHAANVYLTQSS